jgi:hypothetical protein
LQGSGRPGRSVEDVERGFQLEKLCSDARLLSGDGVHEVVHVVYCWKQRWCGHAYSLRVLYIVCLLRGLFFLAYKGGDGTPAGGEGVEGVVAVELEARALAAPAGGEGGELGVGEVVARELEGAEGGALAGGGEERVEAAGGLGEDVLLDGEVAVDGGRVDGRDSHAGRAHAADDVAGEVEAGEGRALGAVEEQGGRAEEADVVVREEELGEAAVLLEGLGERPGAVVVDAVACILFFIVQLLYGDII